MVPICFFSCRVRHTFRSQRSHSYSHTVIVSPLGTQCPVSGKWGYIAVASPAHKGSGGGDLCPWGPGITGQWGLLQSLDPALLFLHHHLWAMQGAQVFWNKSPWIKTSNLHKALGKMWCFLVSSGLVCFLPPLYKIPVPLFLILEFLSAEPNIVLQRLYTPEQLTLACIWWRGEDSARTLSSWWQTLEGQSKYFKEEGPKQRLFQFAQDVETQLSLWNSRASQPSFYCRYRGFTLPSLFFSPLAQIQTQKTGHCFRC